MHLTQLYVVPVFVAQACNAQWFAEVSVSSVDSEYQCGGVFGTFGPIGTVEGRLVQVTPYAACTDIFNAPKVEGSWIALVQRGGNCTFYDKINNVADAGASAVIVGNVRIQEVVIMHDLRSVHIPAVSVSRSIAMQMELSAKTRSTIRISIGPQLTMVNFVLSEIVHDAGVFLVFLVSLIVVISVAYYFRRRRFLRTLAQKVWARRARVAAAVDRLPLVVYNDGGFNPTSKTHMKSKNAGAPITKGDTCQPVSRTSSLCCACHNKLTNTECPKTCYEAKLNHVSYTAEKTDSSVYSKYGIPYDYPDACAICLDDFTTGDPQRALPCRHGTHFHKSCIDPWLTIHHTCPLCKTNFLNSGIPSISAEESTEIALRSIEHSEVTESRTGTRERRETEDFFSYERTLVNGLRNMIGQFVPNVSSNHLRGTAVSVTEGEGEGGDYDEFDLEAEVSWEQLEQIEAFTADQVRQDVPNGSRYALVIVDPRNLNFEI
eukprot:CFRG6391T1